MSVLNRKLLRELRSTGGVLAAISSIMAIGVSAYVSLNTAFENLTTAQSLYYAQCRMADFTLDFKKAPNTELQALSKLPGVVEIRHRIQFLATVDLDDTIEPLNGLVLSLPDRQQPVINDIVLRQGGYFTDRRDNEVIVNHAFARRHHLYPGQWIHLLLNNRRQELFIVGTAISSEFTYLLGPGAMVPDPQRFGVFYLKQTFAEEVFDFEAPSEREHPEATLRLAELLLEDYGSLTPTPRRDQQSHRFIQAEIQGLKAFGVINPAIFLAVASLVLNVLMSRLAEQQRVVVGTLKALGYEGREISLHFLKYGLCVGLVGGLAGCVIGYWIASAMTALYRTFYEFPELENHLYWRFCAHGVLIGLACGVVGSLHGARTVLRLEPAEAMRPKPPAQGGAILLERFTWFWSRLSFGWRATLRSLFRQRFRTGAGIFAATMGSAVSVNALMLMNEIQEMIDFQFQFVQRSDIDLTFKDERGREALDEARRLPGVDHAEPVLDVACTFWHGPYSRKGAVSGMSRNARLTTPRFRDGSAVRIPSAGLAMSRMMAKMLHVERGDLVVIQPTKGDRYPRSVRVEEIVDSYLGTAVYTEIDFLARLVGEEFALSGAQLAVDPRSEAKRSLFRDLKQLPALQSVSARADTIHNVMETLVKNQRVFIGLLVGFAGVIFFGSVFNSSLISLAEREREVATLRVLGYGPWQVGGLFLRESAITTILGTLLGMPLGYELNYGITLSYETEMFRIPVVDPAWSCVITFWLGAGFGLVAHLIVQREILRMDWLEALKTKE